MLHLTTELVSWFWRALVDVRSWDSKVPEAQVVAGFLSYLRYGEESGLDVILSPVFCFTLTVGYCCSISSWNWRCRRAEM